MQNRKTENDKDLAMMKYGASIGGGLGFGFGVMAEGMKSTLFSFDYMRPRLVPNMIKTGASFGFFGATMGVAAVLGINFFANNNRSMKSFSKPVTNNEVESDLAATLCDISYVK